MFTVIFPVDIDGSPSLSIFHERDEAGVRALLAEYVGPQWRENAANDEDCDDIDWNCDEEGGAIDVLLTVGYVTHKDEHGNWQNVPSATLTRAGEPVAHVYCTARP